MPGEVINYTISSKNVAHTVQLLDIRKSMSSGQVQNVELTLDCGMNPIQDNLFSPVFEALSKLNITSLSIKIINILSLVDQRYNSRYIPKNIFNALCGLSSLEHLSIESEGLEVMELSSLANIRSLKPNLQAIFIHYSLVVTFYLYI